MKFFHLLFLFMWLGALLTQTRLLGYHVKLDAKAQMAIAPYYRRMYLFIELPSMIIALAFGILLVSSWTFPLWFDLKMFGALGLVACDVVTGKFIFDLNKGPDLSRGVKYKILHGIAGLSLILVLAAVYLLKPAR